eukprot:CAMPEP_0175040618 /NCGR_PEP_ID=MMETSP0052_2-20121109/1380_1 /TAXON_ID=51329 ORGANISM="Polytomella parva, Strain SAG 63-3" /NCGR_SAMPLE_ID=MMETSP0052_2 /ASSEMBLY_ACC=CAM_ASM_000194 /LENGTH=37 /DNA_ID= /DNA_START= /DNA_END= /DNA_ORIENTATION=
MAVPMGSAAAAATASASLYFIKTSNGGSGTISSDAGS